MDITGSLLVGAVGFGRNVIGIITRPYETYRRIAERGSLWELFFIGVLLAVYFALASIVKTPIFRPFLLTKQFVLLSLSAASGFVVAVSALWVFSLLLGGKGRASALALSWAYTLVPTATWFLTISLLFVILPPPRTTSVPGIVFSLLFLIFSITLLWWKATLAYLAIRFSMKLDLARIIAVVAMSAPILGWWSYLMYRWGIFKVPFL